MTGKRILLIATLVYLLAWPLPSLVVTFTAFGGPTTEVIRGWEATRWALSPLWPDGRHFGASWLHTLLIVASGLSNLLFVVVAWLAWRRPLQVPRSLGWAVWGATLVDLHWLVFAGAGVSNLRIGYYLWVSSFALLALALARLQREGPSASSSKPAA